MPKSSGLSQLMFGQICIDRTMNLNQINDYLERAREIIGDRSPAEIEYDDTVVAHLGSGRDIKKAIQTANQQHPSEALNPAAGQWADVAARYEYLREHKIILRRLGMKE